MERDTRQATGVVLSVEDRTPRAKTFHTLFPAAEFAARRGRVFDAIGAAAALVPGAPPVGGFSAFRQTNEMHYLSGVEVPQAYLLLRGEDRRTLLFVSGIDEHSERSEGPAAVPTTAQDLKASFNFDEVLPLDALAGYLDDVAVLFVPHSPAEGGGMCRHEIELANARLATDQWTTHVPREQILIRELVRRFPRLAVSDLTPILDQLRLVKSEREIEHMRGIGRLCGYGIREAMRSTRPGLREFQLAAAAAAVFLANGADNQGYRPIVATGENAWYPHYHRNDAVLAAGDLVLMDYAPEVSNYTSDIGRMWPVSGKYSDDQRAIYGFVVELHKALIAELRAGRLTREVLEAAARRVAPLVESTRFRNEHHRAAAERALAYAGHLTHPVGMAVHDVGQYDHKPIPVGLVVSIDPQIWIPEERMYVRVEDTVVIRQDGAEVFTNTAPLELDEIEATIAERGVLESLVHPEFVDPS